MSRGSQPSHLGSHFVAPERRWYSLVSPACAASISERSQKAPSTCSPLRVQGLAFGLTVSGLGFRVWGLEFREWGLGLGLGFRV